MRKLYFSLLLPFALCAFSASIDTGNTFNVDVHLDNQTLEAAINFQLKSSQAFIVSDELHEMGYSLDDGQTFNDLEEHILDQLDYTFKESSGKYILNAALSEKANPSELLSATFDPWFNKEIQVNEGDSLSMTLDTNLALAKGFAKCLITAKRAFLVKCVAKYYSDWDEYDYTFFISEDDGTTWLDLNECFYESCQNGFSELDYDMSIKIRPNSFFLSLEIITGDRVSKNPQ